MAVARILGDPQPQQVNINSQFNANPAGVQISNSQSVKFNNNSGNHSCPNSDRRRSHEKS